MDKTNRGEKLILVENCTKNIISNYIWHENVYINVGHIFDINFFNVGYTWSNYALIQSQNIASKINLQV